jgi:hypothetical protein
MTDVDVFAIPRSDLNSFLFADIGVEASGNNLSVLSALARMGMDPWQEGGRLAKLPRRAAADALGKLIEAMPASRWSQSEAWVIASRLVVLLPNAAARAASGPVEKTGQAAEGQWGILFAVLAMIFVGLALNRVGLLSPSPATPQASHAPASPPAPAAVIPPASGQ